MKLPSYYLFKVPDYLVNRIWQSKVSSFLRDTVILCKKFSREIVWVFIFFGAEKCGLWFRAEVPGGLSPADSGWRTGKDVW